MAKSSVVGLSPLRQWWLRAWNLWTAPHNAWVVLITTFIMVESRVWKIYSVQPVPRRQVLLGSAGSSQTMTHRFTTQTFVQES